ncbi:hypothetical protein KDA_08550 [Dictyobacter alpinus]|uniref:FAD/NAD(P)-binding domain-containing protein n=1 Tax=Dictyobacter alpinus TaxID=2014873 RepID=A0A402B1Z5_9CHLR|nr:FAD-dependent oxidoreductase [Dictyobacter alpinus]GCE25371.1 hypothetical protein KDA_08550 [Dictyobacter alpinus]
MSVSLNLKKNQESTPSAQYDVVVLGAGPYGLSVSAHLLGQGLKVATFGKVNHFWRNHMPEGMLLRSYWWASSLSDPQGKYVVARFYEDKGIEPTDPMPKELFLEYVSWFQQHAVPDVDETYISKIIHLDDGNYRVMLEDGRELISKTVVLAPGLHYYKNIPEEYSHLPSSLVSHSSDHSNLEHMKDQKVAIIGAGQAALETAALLYEQGTDVEVICRRPLHWVPMGNAKVPSWIRRIRAPKAGMGDGWKNFFQDKYPYFLHSISRERRDAMVDTTHGPAGSHWLKPRILGKVKIKESMQVVKVEEIDGKAKLTFSTGEEAVFDHIIVCTGYLPDVKSLPMLDQDIKDALQSHRGSPVLNSWFETSIPKLYFVGFSAARSFGPYYRFVLGSEAAARRATASIVRQLVGAR